MIMDSPAKSTKLKAATAPAPPNSTSKQSLAKDPMPSAALAPTALAGNSGGPTQ